MTKVEDFVVQMTIFFCPKCCGFTTGEPLVGSHDGIQYVHAYHCGNPSCIGGVGAVIMDDMWGEEMIHDYFKWYSSAQLKMILLKHDVPDVVREEINLIVSTFKPKRSVRRHL